MKIKMDSLNFKPYTISNINHDSNHTLQALICLLLGKDVPDDKNQTAINQERLLVIIYGIVASKIPGHENDSSILDAVLPLRKKFITQNNYNKVYACNYLLHHFLKAVKDFDNNYFHLPRIEKTVSNPLQLDAFPGKSLASAIAQDIRLLDMHAFLALEIPLKKTNVMSILCNTLMGYIKKDLQSSKDRVLTGKKFELYIKVASKLLERKPIPDFQGAGSVYMALYCEFDKLKSNGLSISKEKEGAFLKLKTLFSFENNYKKLRGEMTLNSIPAAWIDSKDIHFSEENAGIWDWFDTRGKKYYEIAEIKKNIRKVMSAEPCCKTNILSVLEKQAEGPVHGFFNRQIRLRDSGANEAISRLENSLDLSG